MSQATMTTVDVTPFAFTTECPNREKNILTANAASERLERLQEQKKFMLEEILEVFDGTDGLCSALMSFLKKRGNDQEEADGKVEALRESLEAMSKEQREQEDLLLRAIGNRLDEKPPTGFKISKLH